MARRKNKRPPLVVPKQVPAPPWKPKTEDAREDRGDEEDNSERLPSVEAGPFKQDRDDEVMPTDYLRGFSLRGHAKRLAEGATDVTPLFGDIGLSGQLTVIYAEPGSGKTLTAMWFCMDACRGGRANPDLLYYFNADDSSLGLAEKAALLEEVGAHLLAPNHRGLRSTDLLPGLSKMTEQGDAKGRVLIIDTVKKAADVMSKSSMRELGVQCRAFVSAGGTVFALAHTAKSRNPDGSLRYQGTTDLYEDSDAAYTAEALAGPPGGKERIIKFEKMKSRGPNAQAAAYAYSTDPDISYAEKVASVREVFPEELDGRELEASLLDDDEVIQAIRGYLLSGHGHVGKDQMIRAVSRGFNIPRSQVDRVLKKYTGEDLGRHKWFWRKSGPRKQEYYLLDVPYPPPLPGD